MGRLVEENAVDWTVAEQAFADTLASRSLVDESLNAAPTWA